MDRQVVPASGGAEAGAEPLRGLDEGDRIALSRAFRHRPRGEGRHPGHGLGLPCCSAPGLATDDELGLQQGSAGHMSEDDLEVVVEARAPEGREIVVPRRARPGSPLQHGQPAHAAASSATRGTYVMTARAAGSSTSAQTVRMASASTAR